MSYAVTHPFFKHTLGNFSNHQFGITVHSLTTEFLLIHVYIIDAYVTMIYKRPKKKKTLKYLAGLYIK